MVVQEMSTVMAYIEHHKIQLFDSCLWVTICGSTPMLSIHHSDVFAGEIFMSNPIRCPNCSKSTNIKPQNLKGGIIGPLIGYAMADRECPNCGVIALSDFDEKTRSQIVRSRIMWMVAIIVGFIVFVGVAVKLMLAFELIPPKKG